MTQKREENIPKVYFCIRTHTFSTYMPCPFKICFTNKVNAICGGGQLLVTGWVPRSHYEGPGCQDVPCPRVASPKAQGSSSRVPGSHVSGSQCLGSQSLGSQGPGSQGLRIPGSQVSGLRVPGPGSQVLILDYATFLTSLKKIEEFLYLRNKKVIHIKKRRKGFTLLSLFCLHLNSKNRKVTGNIIHNSKWSYITLQASCMSYIFVNINTNWTWR